MLTRQIMRSMTDDELERAIYAEFDARTADVADELRERFIRLVGGPAEDDEETTTPSTTVRSSAMLEQAIADNTAAIRELIATIKASAPTTPARAAPVAKTVTNDVKATVTENNGASSTPGAPFHPAEAAAQEKPAMEEVPPATPVAESVTYEQVKHAILKVASTKSREIAAGILAEFGAAKGPDLKPEQYAGIMARLNDVLSN
jgi:hypothetical protein